MGLCSELVSVHGTLEDHVRDAVCPSCRKKTDNDWESVFCNSLHYITQQCSHCSYELFYKVDFMSSGIKK